MSPASYRAAPPRVVVSRTLHHAKECSVPGPREEAGARDAQLLLVLAVLGLLLGRRLGALRLLDGVLEVLLRLAVGVPVALLQGVLPGVVGVLHLLEGFAH